MTLGKLSVIILKTLIGTGIFAIALTSPAFISKFLDGETKKYNKKRIAWTFYNLKRKGLIKYRKAGKQIYISLTPGGKKRAQELQIDDLKIKIPLRWDGKWRILIFDISEKWKIVREALRGKLKELGFIQLQKSVWIHPFDCQREFQILQTFFNLPDESFMFITAVNIPFENRLKTIFKLK